MIEFVVAFGGMFLFALGGWLGRRLGKREVMDRIGYALEYDGECGVHWMANEKSDRFSREWPKLNATLDQLVKETRE